MKSLLWIILLYIGCVFAQSGAGQAYRDQLHFLRTQIKQYPDSMPLYKAYSDTSIKRCSNLDDLRASYTSMQTLFAEQQNTVQDSGLFYFTQLEIYLNYLEAFSKKFQNELLKSSEEKKLEEARLFMRRYFDDRNKIREKCVDLCSKTDDHLKDEELKSMCRSLIKYVQYEKFKQNMGKNPAPVFSATDVYGKPLSLDMYKGKYILLHFWSMYSHPSVIELNDLKKAYQNYSGKGLVIISVNGDKLNTDLDRKILLNFIKEMDLNWLHIADGNKRAIFNLYFVHNYPTLYLLNQEGYIVSHEKELRGENLFSTLTKQFSAPKQDK